MSKSFDFKKFLSKNSIWIVLIVMIIAMTFASPVFMTSGNLFNMLITESVIGILTMGIVFAILSKGIDLSPGAIVAWTAAVAASLAQNPDYSDKKFKNLPDLPVILIVLIALAAGTVFGLMNGLLIAYTKIPAFIATLGTQLIARSLAYIYTNSYPIPNLKSSFKTLGQAKFFGFLPSIVLFFIVFVCIAGFMLTQTRFGKNVYAIGGNDQAARVAGINVEKNLVKVYTWGAFCASMGGILLVSRSGASSTTMGLNYELDAIAAATVGGTSHSGGIARISGVIAGILILGILKNGMLLLGVNSYLQQALKGVIIIVAVVFDMRKNVKKS
ncbi:ABC transporter permease subunit [Anaerosacchariphilus polymeriproducens]|uniref:Autoinducer 2 import system permease protein LsrD n=1 Tax=Anaerosacchariphilus polymeriproducens TaxID=1812858 RepID=A0A371ARZ4_9FIRM|nr:hypothetical protein [Anaerosacchariphilus polymeriproducens]RDU22329.1 hypothetical protein DWV06_13610 [Anaerosacchariphilus polymeriproducens]